MKETSDWAKEQVYQQTNQWKMSEEKGKMNKWVTNLVSQQMKERKEKWKNKWTNNQIKKKKKRKKEWTSERLKLSEKAIKQMSKWTAKEWINSVEKQLSGWVTEKRKRKNERMSD